MKGQTSNRTSTLLASRIGPQAAPDAAPSTVVALCGEMGAALAPILGPHGVSALYKRSLYLTAQRHPGLEGLAESAETQMDLPALRLRLDALPTGHAVLVGGALIQTFQDVLESLVGSSLTERLLRSLWDRPLSDPPTLESTP